MNLRVSQDLPGLLNLSDEFNSVSAAREAQHGDDIRVLPSELLHRFDDHILAPYARRNVLGHLVYNAGQNAQLQN